ncbi:MAG: RidA family protein [Ardenticatenia bacterium]|uniref:2-iminobutanoate/2-iminopropanoate deaminase n=1 Tax=Ardenticatena maritima TaxID=872965 RepID=A0A0N0RFF3_9CHLR|nr:RidA family protein [Ardenticatena maritima]KPL88270.1 endoribonuclease L-PSP [Ardenticatena maritima]RME12863.1 MAG: RidA family protein [Ardenticatenia bacterium]GAP62427.1 2-iminobutanoate/2-iminopropanoate deaminase [Ardenticatena maritima]
MNRDIIHTDQAPAAIGPYSQAVRAGQLVFTAGQLGIDPTTGKLVEGVEAQTHQAMRNLQAILQAAGTDLAHVVKTTIFVADLNDFATINTIYGSYFEGEPPARSTVQVARLPLDARVEIEMVAVVP